MLTDEIRSRMIEAMKAKDERTKAILRVALGEIQTAQTSSGETLDDPAVVQILRKLVKANEETLRASSRPEQREILEQEVAILQRYLPQTLSQEAVVAALAPVLEAIRAAKSDGQATGVAMKHLKAMDAAVTGQVVSAAVREIRG